MPCPQNVAIPKIFGLYNEASTFDNWEDKRGQYKRECADSGADLCTECGACEDRCPQKIAIINQLKEADAALTV